MPKIVCIDGNIGAGKSTLLNKLASLGFTVFPENHNDWLWALDQCTVNPTRWAFTLQVAVLSSMAVQKQAIDQLTDSVVFIERCPESSMIFTRMWYEGGSLVPEEYNLVCQLYSLLRWQPDVTVKLATAPDECFERIIRRGRPCEASISINYLNQLEAAYNQLDALVLETVEPEALLGLLKVEV